MSWFKRNRGSNSSTEPSPSKDRSNTDPDTLLDVFCSHWQQASVIINNKNRSKEDFSSDEIETVLHNFGSMVTLLVSEEGVEGMPGPILHFFLEKDILELFCSWCSSSREHAVKLRHEQLRMFEMLISQSKQLLLIHKSVIRPLLKLLSSCTDGSFQTSETYDIEHRLVLVLHQACVCISQQFLILESFLCTSTDHGPTRFLLFSLLIPYIHREGPVGQHARDALLLIMTMSAKHPHIGDYIANNSDFCPVLAAGLSGLYSSLPRKIPNPSENWFLLTNEDCNSIPELQMFLNSLEFCNAVVQISHGKVKKQLTQFIYDGFLLPVLGPALHQDISGLPIPLLDTTMFVNSREEVTTATAYLDLFLRRLTEPALIRVFLVFILTEKYDEIVILDSLITRINSSSRLSMVSLALFKTLVDLHCEDVMFQLVFKYLIPCTHVMVSQRRSVKDLDMYGKSAERFLSLRPSCCNLDTDNNLHSVAANQSFNDARLVKGNNSHQLKSPRSFSVSSPPTNHVVKSRMSFSSLFRRGSTRSLRSSSVAASVVNNSAISVKADVRVRHEEVMQETSYMEYLHDAQYKIQKCMNDCRCWSAPYNGEDPSPDSLLESTNQSKDIADTSQSQNVTQDSVADASNDTLDSTATNDDRQPYPQIKLFEQEIDNIVLTRLDDFKFGEDSLLNTQGKKLCDFNKNDSHSCMEFDSTLNSDQCNTSYMNLVGSKENTSLSNLYSSLRSMDCFKQFLDIIGDSEPEDSIEDTMGSIEFLSTSFGVPLNRGIAELGESIIIEKDPEKLSDNNTSATSVLSKMVPYELSEVTSGVFNPGNTSTPTGNRLKDISSYVEITISGDKTSNKDVSQRNMSPVPDSTMSQLCRTAEDMSFSLAQSPGGTLLTASRYSSSTPNIGPFLSALFSKLEGMMQNTLYTNLLLTGILSQLAAYPQPLLRSFLLNHNLVFQPTVKSLVQVLSSVRHKVDTYSYAVGNFSQLLVKARKNLHNREESLLINRFDRSFSSSSINTSPSRVISHPPQVIPVETNGKEKKRMTFTDLLFRKNSPKRPVSLTPKRSPLQRVPLRSGVGYRYINSSKQEVSPDSPEGSIKTWNTVYCAIVLEEFLKELASLAQEQAVLQLDTSFMKYY